MSKEPTDRPRARIADFPPLAARLRGLAAVLGVATLLAMVVDGVLRGLSFGSMVLWVSVYVVCLVVTAAVTVAVHALRGADTAQRRGERLSGDDVGLMPRRQPD